MCSTVIKLGTVCVLRWELKQQLHIYAPAICAMPLLKASATPPPGKLNLESREMDLGGW